VPLRSGQVKNKSGAPGRAPGRACRCALPAVRRTKRAARRRLQPRCAGSQVVNRKNNNTALARCTPQFVHNNNINKLVLA
jgi:hypothetical protein